MCILWWGANVSDDSIRSVLAGLPKATRLEGLATGKRSQVAIPPCRHPETDLQNRWCSWCAVQTDHALVKSGGSMATWSVSLPWVCWTYFTVSHWLWSYDRGGAWDNEMCSVCGKERKCGLLLRLMQLKDQLPVLTTWMFGGTDS